MKWLYRLLRILVRVLIPLISRVRVAGLENVPPTGSLLILCNHMSWYDPFFLGAVLRRQIWFFTKYEVFRWPIIGWLSRMTGQIPVHRGESDRIALEKALAHLREGKALVIFPEGTVERQEQMIEAHPGAALLALRSGVTVLPVAITGTRRLFRRTGGWFPRITIQIGNPYTPTLPEGMSRKAGFHSITDDVMARIAALLPPEQRGVYAHIEKPEQQ